MNFPICKTNIKSSYICNYKLEIHEDKKYFGDLGYVIEKKLPNVNSFCSEYEKHDLNILKKRIYNNSEIKKIDKKFNSTITTHSLEHLNNAEIFN